ncbi:hypothetical protein Tco_1112752 [Tanacetum coccineum]|uniref:Reverse transcriptase domain-containing protein n=1 Tax=Tanacetum coccineum TaxID=301880 RepID=A0ABQ5ITX0_9ASTR
MLNFKKRFLLNELRKLKGKNIVDTAVSKPNVTIAPGMFKLDIETISHILKNNRDAHEVYIKKTTENIDILRGFVEHARTQNPSEPLLESACMFTKHVQELLVYVSRTCPNSPKPSERLVDVIPMNKDKRVRFVKPVTSSSNIAKQTDSLKTKDSNKSLLTSTRVKPTTSARGSKPSCNTKNNRITRPPSSNQKNKVDVTTRVSEEEPQEEEDMYIDGEEDKNEPELTFPYEETNPLNPPPRASDSEPKDVIEVEDTVKPKDEIVLASVHEVGESSIATFLQEDGDRLLPGLMRRGINSLFGWIASISRRLCGRETAHALVEKKGKAKDEYYGKLILDLGNEVRSSMEEGTAAMENLVRKLGNAEERAECKKLKKELEEARFSNTLLRMQNERVERDLYWTRVQAHEFYREMIRRGFVFEERPNEAIDVPVEDEESPSSEPRGSFRDSYVDAAIAAEQARQANARNNASGFRQAKGQVTAPVVRECTFAGFMKCNPDNFRGTEGAVELRRWFEKTEMTFGISECAEDKKVNDSPKLTPYYI